MSKQSAVISFYQLASHSHSYRDIFLLNCNEARPQIDSPINHFDACYLFNFKH